MSELRPSLLPFLKQRDRLLAELSATVGYMRNAKIDLETGCPKKTAIQTLDGGIKRAEAAILELQTSQPELAERDLTQ